MTVKPHTHSVGDPSLILVDTYRATRGRVLKFDVQSIEALATLRRLFSDLSEHKGSEAILGRLQFFVFSQDVKDIILQSTPGNREPSKTIELERETPTGAVFRWTRSSEGWLECAELLDGLTHPGHQYLNRGSSDDAEVEVSFRESAPLKPSRTPQ